MLFFNYSIKIYSTSMTCWREIVTVQAKLFCDHQSVFILNYDKNIENTIFFSSSLKMVQFQKSTVCLELKKMPLILIFFIYYQFLFLQVLLGAFHMAVDDIYLCSGRSK